MVQITDENLPEFECMFDSALCADAFLIQREYHEADFSSILYVFLWWQLPATRAASETRDLWTITPQTDTTTKLQADQKPIPKRCNPIDVNDVFELSRKRQKVIRVVDVSWYCQAAGVSVQCSRKQRQKAWSKIE